VPTRCVPVSLSKMLGFKYIGHVLRELFGSNTRGGAAAAIRLDDDVKTSIADFLGQKMKSRRIGKEWSSVFDENGIDASDLPYNSAPLLVSKDVKSDAYAFVHRVMIWHIATWYCELVEQCKEESTGCSETQAPAADTSREKNRRVAIALSTPSIVPTWWRRRQSCSRGCPRIQRMHSITSGCCHVI